MVYKDQTFCTNYKNCKRKGGCPSPFTDEIYKEALEWWGDNPGYPVFSLTDCREPSVLCNFKAKFEQLIEDQCENEEEIRKMASQILPVEEVFGDSHCVPNVVELVEKIIKHFKEK